MIHIILFALNIKTFLLQKQIMRNKKIFFLKWVEFLHSFNYNDHIQVVCFGTPVKTNDYKQKFIYNENNLNENESKVAK